eukprot:scaffold96075_cov31-Tisochrysis_lutea.AAC.11
MRGSSADSGASGNLAESRASPSSAAAVTHGGSSAAPVPPIVIVLARRACSSDSVSRASEASAKSAAAKGATEARRDFRVEAGRGAIERAYGGPEGRRKRGGGGRRARCTIGGSKGAPGKRGTGRPMAMTMKSGWQRKRRRAFRSSAVAPSASNSSYLGSTWAWGEFLRERAHLQWHVRVLCIRAGTADGQKVALRLLEALKQEDSSIECSLSKNGERGVFIGGGMRACRSIRCNVQVRIRHNTMAQARKAEPVRQLTE